MPPIGIKEYKQFDALVKKGRKEQENHHPDLVRTAFRLRNYLLKILKPWSASNIAVTMRGFETGVNRVGVAKGELIDGWVANIFNSVEWSLSGEMRDVHLSTFVEQLRKKYGAKDS